MSRAGEGAGRINKLNNGHLKWLVGLYRTLTAAVLIGIASILWTSVQTTIKLEERIGSLIAKIENMDERLTWLERGGRPAMPGRPFWPRP